MIPQSLNTFGHMLLDCFFKLVSVLFAHVPAILVVLFMFLPIMVMTTTVRLATIRMVYRRIFPMIPCGMGSSVLVWRLPAVLTPTCRGSPNETTTEDIQLRLCIYLTNTNPPTDDEETLNWS